MSSEDTAIEECKETYLKMAKERQIAGREIPAKPLYLTGDEANDAMIRRSIESTQELTRKGRSKVFSVPDLSFLKKGKAA